MIYGTLLYSGLFGTLLVTVLKANPSTESIPILIPYLFFLIVFSFWYFRQNQLTRVTNTYAKSTNDSKVREHLKALGWEFSSSQGIIYGGSKPALLNWVYVRIIPLNNEILYSFQYSGAHGFRLLFFFGIRTYLKWKFKKQLATANQNQ